jgi:hypothetical protein
MSQEVQNIVFPAFGGLIFILLSIIAWFFVSLAKRWEESHKHHYANNNELRVNQADHHGRIKNVEKELQRHDGLFDDLEEKIEEIKK